MAANIKYFVSSQKVHNYYDNILTNDLLLDICMLVTGQDKFTVTRCSSSYNKGRLVVIEYNGITNYITLSELNGAGRNSSVQSVPTAINIFVADPSTQKRLFYYFLPHTGSLYTDYHIFCYRLMMTVGVIFLNLNKYYPKLSSYNSIDELIEDRERNRIANRSNNSSFVSKSANKVQVYAKVYGANKYESSLLGYAASVLSDKPIDLFNICEKELKALPSSSIATFNKLGNINIYDTSLSFERNLFVSGDDNIVLRSPIYQYNLLNRIGSKRCALCNCGISEIIQGAHIWNVADIKRHSSISDEDKYMHATNSHNGLWLCQNHHKLFDSNIIMINNDGHVAVSDFITHSADEYISSITNSNIISSDILSDKFMEYLSIRNSQISQFTNSHLLSI